MSAYWLSVETCPRNILRRAVEAIAQAGVNQFLDIGSGIPTVGAAHEVARAIHDDARVVYVDHDPIEMLKMWNANSPEPMHWRTQKQIAELFTGFTLLEPGVVFMPLWRPGPREQAEAGPERFASYAALGRKN